MNIVLNGGKLLKDITDWIASFNNKDYLQFGKDIGDFVYEILLSNLKIQQIVGDFGPQDVFNLVKGLL